jgi:hypothetical protein
VDDQLWQSSVEKEKERIFLVNQQYLKVVIVTERHNTANMEKRISHLYINVGLL